MVLLHNSFAIPMKYQQSTVMAQSQYIRTHIPYSLQVKCVEHAIGWLWNWPKGGSAGNKQWLLRQWKGKQYRISQQEGLHGCHEGYLGIRSDVYRDMLPGVDQGHFILSVWSLPFGPRCDFHQCYSQLRRWGARAHSTAQLGYTAFTPGFFPLMKHKVEKYRQTKKLIKKTC